MSSSMSVFWTRLRKASSRNANPAAMPPPGASLPSNSLSLRVQTVYSQSDIFNGNGAPSRHAHHRRIALYGTSQVSSSCLHLDFALFRSGSRVANSIASASSCPACRADSRYRVRQGPLSRRGAGRWSEDRRGRCLGRASRRSRSPRSGQHYADAGADRCACAPLPASRSRCRSERSWRSWRHATI
jgi:hypothetical protein